MNDPTTIGALAVALSGIIFGLWDRRRSSKKERHDAASTATKLLLDEGAEYRQELREDVKALREDVRAARVELAEAESRIDELREQNAQMASELRAAHDEIRQLRRELGREVS